MRRTRALPVHTAADLRNREKCEKTEEAERLIKTIRQLEASLDGRSARDSYHPEDEDLQITYPLTRCIQNLKEKHKAVGRQHRERFEQVKSRLQPAKTLQMPVLTAIRACASP